MRLKGSGTYRVGSMDRPGRVLGSKAELLEQFPDELACRNQLERMRWPLGFHCPCCASVRGERSSRGLWRCGDCYSVTTAACGTAFEGYPLQRAFVALWSLFGTPIGGAEFAGELEVSDAFAWTLRERLRAAMTAPEDRLLGDVEAGRVRVEVGGESEDIAIAVERRGDDVGRIRLHHLRVSEPIDLIAFVERAVAPGSCVRTVAGSDLAALRSHGYGHIAAFAREARTMPGVARATDEVERFVARIAPDLARLGYWLDELAFRHNVAIGVAECERQGAAFSVLIRRVAMVAQPGVGAARIGAAG